MIESKNFRSPCLIDPPKFFPHYHPKPLLSQKGLFSIIIQRLLASSFSWPPLLAKEKGGTNNPEQIKMTFEPFLLYFFSWADFFGEAVIRGLNPTAASRLLTNHCWASFVPMTLISPACQALQKEVLYSSSSEQTNWQQLFYSASLSFISAQTLFSLE